ncbi:MAG: Tn3 family transposase, partial [Frankiaceae bacterium]
MLTATSATPSTMQSGRSDARSGSRLQITLGTNAGIKHVAGGDHGHSEAALRHVRRLHITRDNLRRAIVKLVNATLAARDPALWGTGSA